MKRPAQLETIALLGTLLALSQESQAAPLSWDEFWSRVLQKSPKVLALRNQVEQAKAPVALEVAPPMVAFASTGETGPTSNLMEQTLEISQRIPFPTRFGSAGDVKEARVSMTALEAEVRLRALKNEVFRDFVDLAEIIATRKLVVEKQGFYQSHLKRLQAYTISNQIQQLHILEVEAMLATIQAELRELQASEQGLRHRLGSWLKEEFADQPALGEVKLERGTTAPGLERSPQLQLAHSTETLRSTELALAKSAWAPDLTFTYRRHLRRDSVMPSSHEVMIGIELPFVFPGQPSARSQAAQLGLAQAALESDQTALDLAAQAKSLSARLESTRGLLKLVQSTILPNLEKRMHLLHRLAQTDMESLDLHRSTYEQLLAQQEKYLRLESEYRKTQLELDLLSGESK